MAIKYEEILSKVMDDQLTNLELKYIQEAEDHIDQEIEKQFGKYNLTVEINNSIPTFQWSPKNNKRITDIHEVRKSYLVKELRKRFEDAGWKINLRLDPDGGMNSCDYWILSKK